MSWNSVGCKTQLDGLEIIDSKLLFAEAARLEIPAPQSPERRHLFEIVQSKTVNWKVERRGSGEEKSKAQRRKNRFQFHDSDTFYSTSCFVRCSLKMKFHSDLSPLAQDSTKLVMANLRSCTEIRYFYVFTIGDWRMCSDFTFYSSSSALSAI